MRNYRASYEHGVCRSLSCTEQQCKAHALQAEIDRTDAVIDAPVPAMGPPAAGRLTEEEVKVVEGKN